MPTEVTPCPICEAPAAEALPRHGDVSVVSCHTCGAFKVSGTASQVMQTMDPWARRAKLADARQRAKPGDMPFILA
jgi:Zn ribbon nucleic-acid-binding protein